MKKSIISPSILVLVMGCSTPIDYSDKFATECLSLKKVSVLYTGWCPNTISSFSTPDQCLGIQSLPIKAHDKEQSVLSSYSEYESNSTYWNKKLFGNSLVSSNDMILAKLEVGTKIQINHIYKVQWGTDGYFWDARATILSGDNEGKIVTIPSYQYHLGKPWLTRADDDNFSIDSKFLVSCKNS